MLRVSVVLLSVLCVAYAAQSIGPLEPKPEKFSKVQGCYIKTLDKVIPFGESDSDPNSCTEYLCGSPFITYNTCGVVHANPPLKVVQDKTKIYPGCCPTIISP